MNRSEWWYTNNKPFFNTNNWSWFNTTCKARNNSE